MITDFNQELTAVGGHALAFVAGAEYGTREYDFKIGAAGQPDLAANEPLDLMMQVVDANAAGLTSTKVELVADDDGAGTNEVSLGEKTFLLAALTTALGVRRVARIMPNQTLAATNKYLAAKLTNVGNGTGASKIKVWFQKGSNEQPQNNGVSI